MTSWAFGNPPAPGQQPADPHQVDDAGAEPIEEPVFRDALLAWPVDDVDMGDRKAIPADERREETVQGVEERQVQIDMAADAGEAAGGVTRPVPQDQAANRVRDARLQPLEGRVLAAEPLSMDEAAALADLGHAGQEGRDEGRVILPVAVERDDQRRSRHRHRALDGRRLAARGLVPELPQPGSRRGQSRGLVPRTIVRSVVDHDHLERTDARQRAFDLVHERADIAGLVEHRHDGDVEHRTTTVT